jgi:hypothetical protein
MPPLLSRCFRSQIILLVSPWKMLQSKTLPADDCPGERSFPAKASLSTGLFCEFSPIATAWQLSFVTGLGKRSWEARFAFS